MAKKLSVALSEKAEKYYNEVAYSLEGKKGVATQAEVVNHCLEELSLFEELAGQSVTDYLQEGWPHLFDQTKNNENES